jgi:diguanylate cyclase (GGDEF)-like protein/PAS domain S-box-containing protein
MEKPSTHILLLEDNPGDAGLLKEALSTEKTFPCRLDTSQRLSEGLARLSRESFDAVLLDLYLPDSSGLETLIQVRNAAPQLPIVVLTGLSNRETAAEALRQGAEDFLLKDELDGALLARSIRYALERHKLLLSLQEKEERYFLAAEGANDGLWDWDLKSNKAFFSTRWKLILGFSESEIGDDPGEWLRRIHPQDLKKVEDDLEQNFSGKTLHFANEHRLKHKDGRYRWVLSRGKAIIDGRGQATRIAGSFTDITRHRNLEQQLALRAFYDPLTGLPNRAFFMENLGRAFARLDRHPSSLLAVFFLDVDSLKSVNDNMGHKAGDQLLMAFSQRLKSCVRPNDMVARMGGDEFTVLLEDLSQPSEAIEVADRILESLVEPLRLEGKEASATASIGIAYSDCGKEGPDGILIAADTAMYRAKSTGKARYVIFGRDGDSGEISERNENAPR